MADQIAAAGPPGAGYYRITVKRESDGVASGYIHDRLAVGDQLDVAAPRGTFILDRTHAAVLLISAGIGATPVLAMLHALAAEHSEREIWWLHGARNSRELPFAERLMAAMIAGEAAGGDKRGKQAVALLICTTEAYPFLDLRVDDHPEPLEELQRLYVKSLERYQPFVACLPSRARPTGVTDRASIEAEILTFHAARIHREQ